MNKEQEIVEFLSKFEDKIGFLDSGLIIDGIVNFYSENMGIDMVVVSVMNQDRSGFFIREMKTEDSENGDGNFVAWETTIMGKVVDDMESYYRPDIKSDAHKFEFDEGLMEWGIKSDFVIPLIIQGEVIGTLNIVSDKIDGIPMICRNKSSLLAPRITQALRNAILHEELMESEDKYKLIFDNAQVGIGVIKTSGEFIEANSTLGTIIGYPDQELKTANFFHLIIEQKQKDEFLAILENFGKLNNQECILSMRNHHVCWVDYSAKVVQYKNSEAYLISVIDITHRKSAEELAEKRLDHLQAAEQIAMVGYFDRDMDTGLEYISPGIESLTGIDKESTDYSAHLREIVHKDDIDNFLELNRKSLKNEDGFHTEIRLLIGENDFRLVKVFGRYTRNLNGHLIHRCTIHDVTKSRKTKKNELAAIEALAHSEMFLSESQKVAKIGSYIFNFDLLTWEASDGLNEIFGLPDGYQKDLKGWVNLVHPEVQVELEKYLLEEVVGKRKRFDKEYDIIRINDGVKRKVHGLGELRFKENGDIHNLIGTIQDITERKELEIERFKLEEKMLQAQKMESLGVLAGGIAHDFNNILMGILGNADLAMFTMGLHSPAREYLEEINASSRKAAQLIKQMLAYSGKGQFIIEEIKFEKLIEDILQMLKISIDKTTVLKFDFGEGVPDFLGDPSQVRQLMVNLVINASESIGGISGVIAISTGKMFCDNDYIGSTSLLPQISNKESIKEGMYTFVEISDTGCGMSKEEVKKIFDPFYSTKFTGRGLGLAAVLGIVRGHKGMIKIYSEERKGSTFKILFPSIKNMDSNDVLSEKNGFLNNKWQGTGTFLIADDEESVRSVSKMMIKKLGFTALVAEDGREAVRIFKKHQSEIVGVLLDLTMPHLDGTQVFQQIKVMNPDIKVILTSGYTEQDATQKFIGKGLAGFIQKPYVLKELATTIRKIFET
jgi:PAS domain S-box-containing protein